MYSLHKAKENKDYSFTPMTFGDGAPAHSGGTPLTTKGGGSSQRRAQIHNGSQIISVEQSFKEDAAGGPGGLLFAADASQKASVASVNSIAGGAQAVE